jgi:hypothetical protein
MTNPERDLDREVSEDERRLAREVAVLARSCPYDQLRVQEAGQQAGLHEERVRQITKTWANDGIARISRNGNLIELTTYGERIIDALHENDS